MALFACLVNAWPRFAAREPLIRVHPNEGQEVRQNAELVVRCLEVSGDGRARLDDGIGSEAHCRRCTALHCAAGQAIDLVQDMFHCSGFMWNYCRRILSGRSPRRSHVIWLASHLSKSSDLVICYSSDVKGQVMCGTVVHLTCHSL